MKEIKLYMKNQRGSNEYQATCKYVDGEFIVLKGSKINEKVASSNRFNINRIAREARENKDNVSKDFITLRDIKFPSASTSAQFVCGYSVNGKDCWKNEHKMSIKEILAGDKSGK